MKYYNLSIVTTNPNRTIITTLESKRQSLYHCISSLIAELVKCKQVITVNDVMFTIGIVLTLESGKPFKYTTSVKEIGTITGYIEEDKT